MSVWQKILYDMATPKQREILDEQIRIKELEQVEYDEMIRRREEAYPYLKSTFKGFVQHIPAMISGVEREYLEFDKWTDVYKMDCVQRYMPYGIFAKSNGDNPTLMVLSKLDPETHKFKSWWVIGYFVGFTFDEIELDNWDTHTWKDTVRLSKTKKNE